MKRRFFYSLLSLIALSTVGYSSTNGTYYPEITKMQDNLTKNGFEVTTTNDLLEEKHLTCDKHVSMVKDEKFGTFIFCSSKKAYDASGIKIVDVKVKI